MQYTLHKTYEIKVMLPEVLKLDFERRAQIKQSTLENEIIHLVQKGIQDQEHIHQQLKTAIDHFLASRKDKSVAPVKKQQKSHDIIFK